MPTDTIPPPELDLLYEDGPCFVFNKPGGLLTQAPPGIDSMEWRVKEFLRRRENKTGKVYLGVPHRLDRPVSGAIVFARHVRAARRIAEQFEGRLVKKRYWALVEGNVEGHVEGHVERDGPGRPDGVAAADSGTWRDYVRKMPDRPQAEVCQRGEDGARAAVLHYRVLERLPAATWLEIELETGRMHQIRVQAASRGHPVLGDQQYGARTAFGPQHDDRRQRVIALHARCIQLRHPMTHEPVSVTAPLPALWESLDLQMDAGRS